MERLLPSPYAIGSSGIMLANTFSNYRQCNDADATARGFSPHTVRQESYSRILDCHTRSGPIIQRWYSDSLDNYCGCKTCGEALPVWAVTGLNIPRRSWAIACKGPTHPVPSLTKFADFYPVCFHTTSNSVVVYQGQNHNPYVSG